jgi:hypothetical protein
MPTVAVDGDNNVIWAWSRDDGAPDNDEAYMLFWDEYPRMVKNLIATPMATPGSVRISWSPNTEHDIAAYQIALIGGQMYWIVLATLPSTQTSYDLTGLANGQYSYAVMAVDIAGQNSDPAFVSFIVGPTVQDAINDLQDRFDQLNTSMHDAITGLQGDLQNLQDQNTALQDQNDALQGQQTKMKDDLASAQNLNMMLMIVVIVLLIITMALAARRPKVKAPEPAPSPAAQPPPPQQYQQPPPPQQYPPQQPPYAPP